MTFDTIRVLGHPDEVLHNLCMPRHSDTSIVRGARALDAGKRLKVARELADLTLKQLSEKTGWIDGLSADKQRAGALRDSTIGNYEQGTRSIGPEEAATFARIFDVPDTWFLGVTNKSETAVLAAQRGHKGEIHEPPPRGSHDVSSPRQPGRRRTRDE